MTSDRFRAALAAIRWSHRNLAEQLGCDDRLVRRWAAGGAPIPPEVAAWVEDLARHHEQRLAPTDWRRR